MFDIDAVVIGAGAVGLACGAALARRDLSTLVLESTAVIGSGTSSRNSEVIHAGLYYPTGSLRHRMCVAGRRLLYPYLQARGVGHKACGKLIVATSTTELAQIEQIYARGLENDVEGLSLITGQEAMAMEPALSCTGAIWSAETGIMDSHALMLAYQGELEDLGGQVVFETPVVQITPLRGGGFSVRTGGAEPATLTCRYLVNSAGLMAHDIASRTDGYDPALIPKLLLAKGSYFGFSGKTPFSRLIYPAPVDGGLGVHVTLDLQGRMRFGPDVEWLDHADPARVDYQVDLRRADGFYAAIRRYWPGLPDGAITPDYAGCRPKLSGPGEPAADFRIDDAGVHGIEGLVHLFGIESPGLTSSLAIAEDVVRQIAD
ncbi:MAG: NAD(P)/FAD-dependent oxidoreductase [Caulobacterales bacterium]